MVRGGPHGDDPHAPAANLAVRLVATAPTPPPKHPFGQSFMSGEPLSPLRFAGSRILIVEDEVFIAAEIKRALEAAGAQVLFARKLERALVLLESERFDGAILDVTLARHVTCAPVADRLRALGVPFVLHSGDLVRADEAVMTLDAPLVPKPAAARDVLRALAHVMGW